MSATTELHFRKVEDRDTEKQEKYEPELGREEIGLNDERVENERELDRWREIELRELERREREREREKEREREIERRELYIERQLELEQEREQENREPKRKEIERERTHDREEERREIEEEEEQKEKATHHHHLPHHHHHHHHDPVLTPEKVILPFFQNSPMQVRLNILSASLIASVETGFYCSNIPSILVSSRIASAIPRWFEHYGIHLEWSRFVLMKTPVPGDNEFKDSDVEIPANILPPLVDEDEHSEELKRHKSWKGRKSRRSSTASGHVSHKMKNFDEYSFAERYKAPHPPPSPPVEHRTKVKLLVSTNAIPFTCEETCVTFPLHVVKYHPRYELFDVGVNLLSFQAIFSLRILADYVQIQHMEQKIIQLEQKLKQRCSIM